ncbi:MAG: vitamin K epoxide reductase family protein [Armatimonadetes bacterium]|nr:vitamin K epoxide reductase family protein [Armatimonadota bacterium]
MSTPPAVPGAFYWTETALSVVGAGIAGTLWWAHRSNIELPCTGDGHGCDLVNDSPWAHVTLGPWHDVPVALLGFLTYLVLLTLAMMKLGADTERGRRRLHGPFWAISLFGAGYSLYLQYVAHVEIGAFCVWCFSSAVVMALLFLTATVEAVRRRSAPSAASPETGPVIHV